MSTAADTVDAARLKKRMRQTLKMQRYRKRLLEKADMLRATVSELEQAIYDAMQRRHPSNEVAQPSTLLPWEQVVRALRDESELATKDNVDLQRLCKTQGIVLLVLKQWVASFVVHMRTPRGTMKTWRHVTLGVHPASRVRGCDWITLQMLHHVDRVFQQCHFPPLTSTDVVDDFVIGTTEEDDDDTVQYMWRDQREVPYAMEVVRELFARPHYTKMVAGGPKAKWIAPDDETAAVVAADNYRLRELDARLHYVHSFRGNQMLVRNVAREFDLPDRCVFVAQNIHDDELLPNSSAAQRNRTSWFVLDRISSTRTKMRALSVLSQQFTKTGFVDLADEAKAWGLDVKPTEALDSAERRVHHRISQICSFNGSTYNRELDEALASTAKKRIK
ncbi:Aste57867_18913 [Aphanomyces stellatus]|uniref:Aste57867_18913 protein n=1 Tax=Aphanomyces stellatus TaxID=120398 RepID=A0A485LBM5_9STRA|nr:hypothetical protein As57867_018849 [Aphanomyces stellatus]VFT95645.1 Aste57867_18913 [Aphanomyces stellatus]